MKSWFRTVKQALQRPLGLDPAGQGKAPESLWDDLKCLYPPLRKNWRRGALGAALACLAALITLPQPLIIRHLIDRVILDRQLDYLPAVMLLIAGIGFLSLVLGVMKDWYAKGFEQRMNMDLRENLYAHLFKMPKGFFEKRETGYLLSRVQGDVSGVGWFYSASLVNVAVQIVRFGGGLICLFSLEWRLTLLALAFLPLAPAATYFFSRRIHDLTEAAREDRDRSHGATGESLGAVSLIKSCTAEKRALRQLLSATKTSEQSQLEQSALNQASRIAGQLGPAVAQLAILCIGAYWVAGGRWSLGSLVAFQAYAGSLFGPLQSVSGMNIPFRNARVALERVNRFFNLVPEENYDQGSHVQRLSGAVEFRGVSFSYDRRSAVIDGLNFRVNPGEHVAIVGPSGIGKTTLLSLLLLFYRPDSGMILFDGEPASSYEVQSLRRRIGYMAQTTMLLSLSILENVRYGNPDATPEDVRRACRIAGIEGFIDELPEGLDTVLGPSGVNVSEGQAQRLSLARALVKDPDILVLDEPTSAVDLVTERSILRSLPSVIRGKTLFIVAHRLSTIRDCSRILLLDENRVLACGTHESLLRSNDYYRLLIDIHRSPGWPAAEENSSFPSRIPGSCPAYGGAGTERRHPAKLNKRFSPPADNNLLINPSGMLD